MASEQHEQDGTYMRGADGGVYFIPDAVLESCRIPDSTIQAAMEEPADDVEGHSGELGRVTVRAVRGRARIAVSAPVAMDMPTPTLRRAVADLMRPQRRQRRAR